MVISSAQGPGPAARSSLYIELAFGVTGIRVEPSDTGANRLIICAFLVNGNEPTLRWSPRLSAENT